MFLDKKYSISSSVILQTIDEESLLMDEETHLFYELNSTGAFFWEILQEYDVLSDAFSEIVECFDVSKEQLENDFSKFISDLIEQGVIEIDEQ